MSKVRLIHFSSILLTFFTQRSLLSPLFSFFNIATCVCVWDELPSTVRVWFRALCIDGTSSFNDHFSGCTSCPLPLFSLSFSVNQPKPLCPCANNTMQWIVFPSFHFFPLPSLLPQYSCLIVNCSSAGWIAAIKTKLCPCWPKTCSPQTKSIKEGSSDRKGLEWAIYTSL